MSGSFVNLLFRRVFYLSVFVLCHQASLFADSGDTEYLFGAEKNICSIISERVKEPDYKYEKFAPVMGSKKKIFIGENPLKYNKDDFYIFTYEYDVNNDSDSDLIAIDWRPRGGNKFILAYYVYLGKGDLHGNRKQTQSFLRKKNFLHRRNTNAVSSSEPPSFSDRFEYISASGESVVEGFLGYYEIVPTIVDNKIFVLAKKQNEKSNNWLLFDFSSDVRDPELICYLRQKS